MRTTKCYSELQNLKTYDERFRYLQIGGHIGIESFGYDRYLNQAFYKSPDWKRIRDKVIIRDNGCDLSMEGYPIQGRVIIHHMNAITIDDVLDLNPNIFNPEYLICVSHQTHNALHYGDETYPDRFKVIERRPNDTIPWKQ